MKASEFGSLANHPDLRRAVKAGKVKPAPKLPPCLALPFYGKPDKVFALQTAGLAARLSAIGCRQAVVGLSGGLDSALALLVVSAAFNQLGLDRKGIHVFTMPGFGTTTRTKGNAELLAEGLGVKLETISIAAACRRHLKDIGHDGHTPDIVYENCQARMRTMILMDKANQVGGIVVGTGDLSELALGWATYNGDHMSMYAVNASVPKTLVRYLIRYFADTSGDALLSKTLYDVLDTPVSPELLPPEEGGITQKTEDILGPYELHDFFLYHMLRLGSAPDKILRLAKLAFAGAYEDDYILSELKLFYRRFFAQHFTRSCRPDGPKVGSVAVSPRGDLRMPSDACADLWLRILDKMNEEKD